MIFRVMKSRLRRRLHVRTLFRGFSFSVLLLAACSQSDKSSQGDGSKTKPAQAAASKFFKTHFQTEAEFIVETVCTDLNEMLLYSRGKTFSKTAVSVSALERQPTIYRK